MCVCVASLLWLFVTTSDSVCDRVCAPQLVQAGLTSGPPGGNGAYYTLADSPNGPGVAPYKDESGITRDLRSEQKLCPLGYYCQGGVRYPCPGDALRCRRACPLWW